MPKDKGVVVPSRPIVQGSEFGDQFADGARVVGDRVVEIEPRDVVQISEVLAPQRLVEPEALLILARHLLDAALHIAPKRRLLQKLGAHRILPREARQEEIERGGEPDDQQENAEAARYIGGLHLYYSDHRNRPAERSIQCGLSRSIRLIFQARLHSLICFSRRIAASAD